MNYHVHFWNFLVLVKPLLVIAKIFEITNQFFRIPRQHLASIFFEVHFFLSRKVSYFSARKGFTAILLLSNDVWDFGENKKTKSISCEQHTKISTVRLFHLHAWFHLKRCLNLRGFLQWNLLREIFLESKREERSIPKHPAILFNWILCVSCL